VGRFSAISVSLRTVGEATAREDPTLRMDRLDAFLAAGRVSQAEYDAKRVQIVDDI
jgi:hypothetical protein